MVVTKNKKIIGWIIKLRYSGINIGNKAIEEMSGRYTKIGKVHPNLPFYKKFTQKC